jgi:hypothetical protein
MAADDERKIDERLKLIANTQRDTLMQLLRNTEDDRADNDRLHD